MKLGFLVFTFSCFHVFSSEIDFAHEVVPILKENCLECHGGDESKGGFSMNSRALFLEAEVLDLEHPKESLLIEVLHSEDPDERMPPPKKSKEGLSEKEIATLEKWIEAGLPWEPGVSFAEKRYEPPLKPRKVDLPVGPEGANPIDLIVGSYFQKKELKFPSPVSDQEFLRRLSLDLHGLVPTGPLATKTISGTRLNREETIDTLLNDNQKYAEHWMVFWNDLLRNEYVGTGFIDGGRTQVTGWLYRALLENKKYDEFVHQLVSPTDESRGFITGFKWRGVVNASQTQEVQFSQNLSQVFLGINMKCASCHDSFIDRWTLEEAYGLAAIVSEKPLELTRCDKPTGKIAKASWIFPELGEINPNSSRSERLSQLADLMVHPENGRMQRTIVNRLWKQMMGRGIAHPVDAMNTEPWSEDLLDYLANHLVESDYDLKKVLRLIASSRIYQSQSEIRKEGSDYVFNGPVRKRLTAEEFLDSIRTIIDVWPEPPKAAFAKSGARNGQLNAVMAAHGLKEWDNRPVRAVFARRELLQATLGRPNREQVVTSRPDILTTLEAIALANGTELTALLQAGAKKSQSIEDDRRFVEHLFLTAFTRRPTLAERETAIKMLREQDGSSGREDLLWTIFMTPEFQFNN